MPLSTQPQRSLFSCCPGESSSISNALSIHISTGGTGLTLPSALSVQYNLSNWFSRYFQLDQWIHPLSFRVGSRQVAKGSCDLATAGKCHLGIHNDVQCHWIPKLLCICPGLWPLRQNCSRHRLFSFRPQHFYICCNKIAQLKWSSLAGDNPNVEKHLGH